MRALVHGLVLAAGLGVQSVQDLPVWTLDPELRIGSVDGDSATALSPVTGLFVDSDGRTYVLQRGVRSVRVFDSGGAFVGDLGGAGAGPSEFQAINLLRWLGDTLVVGDATAGRITLFHDGRHVADFRIPPPFGGTHSPLGVLPGRQLLLAPLLTGSAIAAGAQAVALLRTDPEGRVVRSIASVGAGQTAASVDLGESRRVFVMLPFAHRETCETTLTSFDSRRLILLRSADGGRRVGLTTIDTASGEETLFSPGITRSRCSESRGRKRTKRSNGSPGTIPERTHAGYAAQCRFPNTIGRSIRRSRLLMARCGCDCEAWTPTASTS
jgi:hypothetical protein